MIEGFCRWSSTSLQHAITELGNEFMPKQGYKRATRVADQVRAEVAEILLKKTKDPRLQSVTVTDVELTKDLRLAHVFVTTILEGEDADQVMEGLRRATGFIRRELDHRLSLRYSPVLVFRKDTSGVRGDRILEILAGLHEGSRSETTEEYSSPVVGERKPEG